MTTGVAHIAAYLEVLHKHRDLVADAYINGGITLTDETQRALYLLKQHRALVPAVQDEFRLNSSLSRHLDEVFLRQRNYAVSANFAEQIDRLPQLIDEYLKACLDNRAEDRDTYSDDFKSGVFELAEGLDSFLALMRSLADNRFANVSTLEQKKRQNEFYLGKCEQIGIALGALQDAALLEQLSGSSLLQPLQQIYQSQILERLPQWRASLMDISTVLKEYLYRLRQVEPQAQRLRAFAQFLRKNPDYIPPDVDELNHLPDWCSTFEGFKISAHADLSDNLTRDALVEVAQSIPAPTLRFAVERQAGQMITDDAQGRVNIIAASPVQRAFALYLKAVRQSQEPISAIEWLRKMPDYQSIDEAAWLVYLLHAWQILEAKKKISGLAMRRVENTVAYPGLSEAMSGNLIVSDVEIWKKA
ncbi:hypothetical protein ABHF33_15195 [Chitinibacter sp. FCG-7]|uniref:Uncharacterized protein n=1 Tax=Chitinibacter mangrovi TaxID=3153927 RepID=A0AAU7F8K0_9NEIS